MTSKDNADFTSEIEQDQGFNLANEQNFIKRYIEVNLSKPLIYHNKAKFDKTFGVCYVKNERN